MGQYWRTGDSLYFGDPYGEAVEITESEYLTMMQEQAISRLRAKRDSLIASVEWRVRRHQDEVALGLEPTEGITPVLQYMQALRDVPQQQGFPDQVDWPVLQEDDYENS